MATASLGIDVGTSGVRVLAVDETGRVLAETSRAYPLHTPQPGWTEQDPADWFAGSVAALAEAASRLAGHDIAALGLSGQMHGMVPLDGSGEVVRPALLWNDQRTGDAVVEMNEHVGRDTLVARGGNPAVTGFQLPKLLWLRSAEPEAFARTRHCLLPKDYLGYRLCGTMAAEPSDASGSNCFHLASRSWDEQVLAALDIDPGLFPDIVESHAVTGQLTSEIARATGLPAGLPIVAGAGDNAAAAIGLGLSRRTPGLGSVSLGTSGVIFLPLEQPTPDPQGRVHLFCHADGGYHLLGVTLAAAGSLSWYRNTLAPDLDFEALIALAADSPPGANGAVFRPYLAGERTPHMDPDLRASFGGLSLATTRGDTVRALLEGVAFSLRDALDVITPLARAERLLATGGGSRNELWLQIVAAVLQLPLARPRQNQGAAYGAALLAQQGVGMIEDAAAAAAGDLGERIDPGGFEPYREALARYRS